MARPKKTDLKKPVAKVEETAEAGTSENSSRHAELILRIKSYITTRQADGYSLRAFAADLGVSYSAIVSITNGSRWAGASGKETLERISVLLGVPLVQVYIWSGILGPFDFFTRHTLAAQLDLAYAKMARYPMMMPFCPSKERWDVWPEDARIALAGLFESTALGNVQRSLDVSNLATAMSTERSKRGARIELLRESVQKMKKGIDLSPTLVDAAWQTLEIFDELGFHLPEMRWLLNGNTRRTKTELAKNAEILEGAAKELKMLDRWLKESDVIRYAS